MDVKTNFRRSISFVYFFHKLFRNIGLYIDNNVDHWRELDIYHRFDMDDFDHMQLFQFFKVKWKFSIR